MTTKTKPKPSNTQSKNTPTKQSRVNQTTQSKKVNMKSDSKKSSTKATTKKSSKNARQKLFDELKTVLIEERNQLLEKALRVQNVKDASNQGDIVDQSNDYINRELLMGMAEHDKQHLEEIDDAIKRMEAGTYGICQSTGQEISEARLRAMPTAKYTIEVQSKMEHRR